MGITYLGIYLCLIKEFENGGGMVGGGGDTIQNLPNWTHVVFGSRNMYVGAD